MRPAVGLLLFYKEKNEENTANIYGPREFTPNEVLTACGNWGANGLNTWALPSECNGKIDTSKYTHGGKVQATVFSAVKASIDNNLPIIIRLNSSNGKKTHSNAATFLGVLALVGLAAGGGIYTFMKQKQKKQAEKEALDPDANYTEDKGDFEIPVEDEPEETGEEDNTEE